MGWPAEEGTTVVALVELGGMAEGEGLVEIFLGAILCGCEVFGGGCEAQWVGCCVVGYM